MWIEHFKLSQRGDSFLKQGKGTDRNGSKREEGHLGSAAAPACSTQSLRLCEDGREGPAPWSPFHMDSWLTYMRESTAWVVKTKQTTRNILTCHTFGVMKLKELTPKYFSFMVNFTAKNSLEPAPFLQGLHCNCLTFSSFWGPNSPLKHMCKLT